jgi:serine phosphatase RsbU (regulator of sigma subunit)
MFEKLLPAVEEVRLQTGDALFVYSDGLLEAKSPEGEEIGEEGLVAIARDLLASDDAAAPAFPRRLVDHVVEGLGFQQTDDMTLVLLRAL